MATDETAHTRRWGPAPRASVSRSRQGTGDPTWRRDVVVAALLSVLAGIGGGTLIYLAVHESLNSDYLSHMLFTWKLVEHGIMPPGDFLFYVLNATFSGFSGGLQSLTESLAFVLGAAIAAKVWLAIRFVAAERRAASSPAAAGPLPLWAAGATALCLLAFSLPVHSRRYIGQIPPNVWHNSTEILLMPLAFALFWTTLRFLETAATRWLWWSLPLVALSLAAKPSFALCLLPALALLAWLRFRWTPPFQLVLLLLGAAVVLLAAQTAYVYAFDAQTAGGSGIAIHPLVVWRFFSASIPLSLLASCIFPVAALALGGSAVRATLAVRYAALLLLIALAEYALLAERGRRELEGNLTWQSIVAMWILFIALVSALVPWYERRRFGWRQLLIAAALLVQVAAGVAYLAHWFSSSDFL